TFDNRSLMIICMNKSQAIVWKNIECFQIDMVFKRVRENINEFEINNYCENYNQKESPMINYIHNKGWKYILGDLDQEQAKELGLALANIEPKNINTCERNNNIKQLMIEISTATTKLRIEEIFETLKKINTENLEG
ncbi:31518_t:CDS:2, partial [Racocetra persica]